MTVGELDLRPAKLALRRTLRAQREVRSAEERARLAELLGLIPLEMPAIRRASCVAVYAARPEEPGTAPLRQALRERGTRVLLPVIVDDETLNWADDPGDPLPAGRFNIPAPPGPALGADALSAAAVVLVPALAVDTLGIRLGQGRGYFDRALHHAAPDALVLALLFDDEVLDAAMTPVPREPHDRPIHGVITPTKWMLFG